MLVVIVGEAGPEGARRHADWNGDGQVRRVSNQCAFFLAAQGEPGHIVEHGPTDAMFGAPQDPRTADYVNGRFG